MLFDLTWLDLTWLDLWYLSSWSPSLSSRVALIQDHLNNHCPKVPLPQLPNNHQIQDIRDAVIKNHQSGHTSLGTYERISNNEQTTIWSIYLLKIFVVFVYFALFAFSFFSLLFFCFFILHNNQIILAQFGKSDLYVLFVLFLLCLV